MKTKVALIQLFDLDLGIRYISSYLNSKGYFTNIISFGEYKIPLKIICKNYITASPTSLAVYQREDVELLINLLTSLKPDLIGISLASAMFTTASFLTRKIKERLDIPVIWGGIHPTVCPEECIKIADIVCIGEGEYPMYELAQKLENKEEITSIKNLWIRKRDGSIEKNELRDLISDLDSLPYPDFVGFGNKFLINNGKIISGHVNKERYLTSNINCITSRGCCYNCPFCYSNTLKIIYKDKGPFLRRRSPENVIDELVYIRKNMEVFRIFFVDDIFIYDYEWIEKFCQLYIKKVSLPFSCNTHPKYTNKKIIEMLVRAGLIQIFIGMQSGSRRISREIFKRNQSNEEIIEFGYTLKKLNITPAYEIILDNPYESDFDLDTTAELLLRLPRPYYAQLFSLCYFPQTEITNQALKDKLITEEEVDDKSKKSLTNFVMFLDLVKDKKHLFWDLIIAMTVSDFFSEKLIRRCKRTKFFRYHPKILLIIIRLYLRISCISPIFIFDYFFKKNKKLSRSSILLKKAPMSFFRFVNLYLKISQFFKYKNETFVICNLLRTLFAVLTDTSGHTLLVDKTGVDLIVFPKDSISTFSKGLYLKIIRRFEDSPSLLPVKLLVCLFPLNIRTLGEIKGRLACWEMNFNLDNNSKVEIEVDLLLPRLFFVMKGIRREAPFVKGIRNTTKKGSHMIYFFIYDRFQRLYILKNCSIIHLENILNSDKENRFLYPSMNHL